MHEGDDALFESSHISIQDLRGGKKRLKGVIFLLVLVALYENIRFFMFKFFDLTLVYLLLLFQPFASILELVFKVFTFKLRLFQV